MCRIFLRCLTHALFGVFLFLAGLRAFAVEPSGTPWQDAEKLYAAGKFNDAFELLKSSPSDNATYYYDLGTIASALGKPALSLGYFEKALRKRPHDPDIQRNLEAVKRQVEQNIGTDQLDLASSWMESLADHLPIEELRGVLGLLGLVLSFFWIRAYRRTRRLSLTILRPSSLIASTAFLVVVALYLLETDANTHIPAVALMREPIRSGPGASYVQLGEVLPGMTVRLLGPSSGSSDEGNQSKQTWLQVRYNRDGIGWLKASDVLVVD